MFDFYPGLPHMPLSMSLVFSWTSIIILFLCFANLYPLLTAKRSIHWKVSSASFPPTTGRGWLSIPRTWTVLELPPTESRLKFMTLSTKFLSQ